MSEAQSVRSSGQSTQSSALAPIAATRGKVQKTFVPARVLSGFADASHVEQLIGDYLQELPELEKARLVQSAEESRAFVSSLPAFSPQDAVLGPILSPHIESIIADSDPINLPR